MQTLIGLLAASGLRVGEALRLDRGDIDWSDGVLHIRQSKFNKSRLVPLSPSVLEALERYAHLRDRERPAAAGESFFVSLRGTRVIHECVWKTFRALCDSAGIGAEQQRAAHDPRPQAPVRCSRARQLVPAGRRRSAPPGLALDLPRASRPGLELLVSVRRAGAARARRPPARRHTDGDAMTLIAATIQAFFTERLAGQLQASPRTIASYRDTLRLLLHYTHQQTGKTPVRAGLGGPQRGADLRVPRAPRDRARERAEDPQPAADRDPVAVHVRVAAGIQNTRTRSRRVLAIPPKRHQQRTITYLSAPEAAALINAPDRGPLGRPPRSHAADARDLHRPAGLRTHRAWTAATSRSGPAPTFAAATAKAENRERCRSSRRCDQCSPPGSPNVPVNPTTRYSRPAPAADSARDAIAQRVSTHAATAAITCPSLNAKHLHPHVLRHSCAMSLLQAGVDTTVIALWLGHADVRSTDPYIHADMTIKEKALALVTPPDVKPGRYKPPDKLLAFLEGL